MCMSKSGRCGANMHCRGYFWSSEVRYSIVCNQRQAVKSSSAGRSRHWTDSPGVHVFRPFASQSVHRVSIIEKLR